MNELYPSVESMSALTVFQLYEGSGEWFDLSKKPIERAGFTFGGGKDNQERINVLGVNYVIPVVLKNVST